MSFRKQARRFEKEVLATKAATKYNWNGETLTLSELIKQAESKSIAFMSGGRSKGDKPTYHINMPTEDEGVISGFKVTFNQWDKISLPDATSDPTKNKFVAWSGGRNVWDAPKISDSEYQEALKKVKSNKGKPVLPPDPLGGRRIRF